MGKILGSNSNATSNESWEPSPKTISAMKRRKNRSSFEKQFRSHLAFQLELDIGCEKKFRKDFSCLEDLILFIKSSLFLVAVSLIGGWKKAQSL